MFNSHRWIAMFKAGKITEGTQLSFKEAGITDLMDLKNATDTLSKTDLDWDQKGQAFMFKSSMDKEQAKQFLELDESINEAKKKLPKFKNIPSWASYVAQSSDGEWTWYEDTPTMIKFRDGSGGAWKQDGNQTYTGVKTNGKDWDKIPTYYNVKNNKITESSK